MRGNVRDADDSFLDRVTIDVVTVGLVLEAVVGVGAS
jgi:hypothetical protein